MKNLRRILLALLMLSLSGVLFADTIEGTLSFDKNKIAYSVENNFDIVEYSDLDAFYDAEPGAPFIPKYGFKVVIPSNAVITTITINNISKNVVDYSFNAYPTQPMSIIDEVPAFVGQDSSIYGINAEFPYCDTISSIGYSKIRGYKLAELTLNLFSYNPVTDDLSFVDYVEYSIEYSVPESATYGGGSARYSSQPNELFKGLVQEMVTNPQSIDSINESELATFGAPEALTGTNEQIDLIIITSNALKSAFETYADYRTKTANVTSKVIALEDLYATYSGATDQLKIKNCIYDYVSNYNTNYVILGGDDTVVPDQDCYMKTSSYEDFAMPADLFYTCFDDAFDWDADGDGIVGETTDNTDLSPDVFIGRLPVRTAQHVADYQEKLKDYLYWADNSDYTMSGLLLIGVKLWVDGDAQLKSEAMFDDYIEPYWPNNRKGTLYDDDANVTLTKELVSEKIQSYNAVHMATHGNPTAWAMESGGSFRPSDAEALNGRPTGVIATIACNTNAFENYSDPCLSEGFIRNRNGGSLVYVGGSRYGWGSPSGTASHGTSFRYNDAFFEYLLNDHTIDYLSTSGIAFALTKQKLAAGATSYSSSRWVQFSLNFMGDPTIKFQEQEEFFWWERVRDFKSKGIATGVDGTICALGNENLTNGSKVYKFNGSDWDLLAGVEAVSLDVDPNGNPWVVSKNGSIYKWTGSSWQSLPGLAKDISIGGNGVAYMIDYSQGGSKGNYIAYWDGSTWTHVTTIEATSISVDGKGNPWIVDNTGHMSFYNGSDWEDLPGKGSDIAVSADGKVFITGYAPTFYGHYTYRWTGTGWQKIFGEGIQVEVGPNGVAYHVNNRGDLYFGHPEDNMVFNGDFHAHHVNGWNFYNMDGAVSTPSSETEPDGAGGFNDVELKMEITNGGTEKWSVLAIPRTMVIEQGETYTVSFWARQANANGQSVESDITVSLDAAPWTEYGAMSAVFTEEMKRYSFTFTMTEPTDNDAILQFCIGKLQRDVYIDSVSLVKHIKDTQAPSEVTGLAAVAGESTISLSWDESIDNSGSVLYLIRYKASTASDYTEVTTTDTSYVLSSLAGDTYHYIYVSAKDAAGNQSPETYKGIRTLEPTVPAWVSTQVYNGGDLVSYNGNIYKAKWWTQGETPGVASVWELQ